MTRTAEDADLQQRLSAARTASQSQPDSAAITAVVKRVLSSLSGDMSAAGLKLYRELEELSHVIEAAKREIAAIQPHDIRDWHIPMATDELDAVVAATAEATGAILGAAEVIERSTEAAPAEMKAILANEVTRIYEACNFQDITGQRITKVVNTLKAIEAKVAQISGAFGTMPAGQSRGRRDAPVEAVLLNGPQLPAAAMDQADIDKLLASFD